MQHPLQEFRDTQANIEALATAHVGAVAYATDHNLFGTFDGTNWNWVPDGGAGPGYWGFWTYTGVDGVGETLIPNGAGDVASGITTVFWVEESAGGTGSGT